jgi:hypothetical protein
MESPAACNVFISWSKPRAKALAQALHEWLPQVNHKLKPWVSSRNISVGERWNDEIWQALRAAKHGIICVTPENQHEPWLLFEAGAMANNPDVPISVYRFGMSETDVEAPLGQFQSAATDRDGTLKLLESLNASLALYDRQPETILHRQFGKWWPELSQRIDKTQTLQREPQGRSVADMVREILSTVRSLPTDSIDSHTMERAYANLRRYWYLQRNSELRNLDLNAVWYGQTNHISNTFTLFVGDGSLSHYDSAHRFELATIGEKVYRTNLQVKSCKQMPGFFVAELVPPQGAAAFEVLVDPAPENSDGI